MKSFYIKGTNEKYSIREDGNVIVHWRFQNNGKKRFQDKLLSKCFNGKKPSKYFSPAVSIKYGNDKPKLMFINTLMVEYFKIQKPDNHHQYRLYPLDGNNLNNSVNNLAWEIKTIRDYEYKPKAISKNGLIVSKICGICGENRDIVNYTLSQNPNHKNSKSNKTCFRNVCEPCRSQEQWDKLVNDPIALQRSLKIKKDWMSTKEGKAYHKKYREQNGNRRVVELQDCYVRQQAIKRGFQKYQITPEMIETFRIMHEIKREVKSM